MTAQSQTGTVGAAVPLAPGIRVLDQRGAPMPGIPVTFSVLEGGGSLEVASAVTGPDGVAAASWVLGGVAGMNRVAVWADGLEPVIFSAEGMPDVPAALEVVSGDEQSGPVSAALEDPVVVRVADAWGNAVSGIDVRFEIMAGGGTIGPKDERGPVLTVRSDALGLAHVDEWTPGEAGTNTLIAAVDGVASVTVTATATVPGAGTGGGYHFDLVFTGPITESQRAAALAASARWTAVLAGDLAAVTLDIPANACGVEHPAIQGTVDDLLIVVAITTIDGRGGVLGSAGPCYLRSAGGLPVLGAVRLDLADMPFLESGGRLVDVLAHEFGHVLGIGTRWYRWLEGAGTSDPTYHGPAAMAAFEASGSSAQAGLPVPIENTGGPGTRDGHWRESIFASELMTGWLNSGANPLSAITVGALADLGYVVDALRAEPFIIASASPAFTNPAAAGAPFEISETALPVEPVSVDRRGRPSPLRPFRR